MSDPNNLPGLSPGDTDWSDTPPDPFDWPELYDGLIWRRAIGYLVDIGLITALSLCAWMVLGVIGVLTFGLLAPLGIIAIAVLPAAYHTLFIALRGATPGMALFDVEVRSWIGARPDILQAFLLTVLFYLSVALTAWLILAVALFNDRQRTAHDYLAGTVALRRSRLGPHILS